MPRRLQTKVWLRIPGLLTALIVLPPCAFGWNIPAHMLSGAIAYQILRGESPSTIADVKTTLESHPWFENHWRAQLEKLPIADQDEFLFLLAARWADDIRTKDRSQNRGPWHYINLPFKPEGQPDSVRPKSPAKVNILTALRENERSAKAASTATQRSIALTWLFHLVGDVHQPLHTSGLFTVDYPDGDRGGNEICARPATNRKAIDIHLFWDGVITPSSNITWLHNEAIALRNRPGFARDALSELGSTSFETWAKESYEIATKIAYLNGAVPGTPKGSHKDCGEVEAGCSAHWLRAERPSYRRSTDYAGRLPASRCPHPQFEIGSRIEEAYPYIPLSNQRSPHL